MTMAFYVLLVLILGAGVWIIARALEKKDQLIKVQSAEARIQMAQSRASQLNDHLLKAQNEILLLTRTLEDERREKTRWVMESSKVFKKQNVWLGGFCMTAGLWVGALLVVMVYHQRITDARVAQASAETRATMLASDLSSLGSRLQALEKSFREEMEARIVAQTKLEIILGQPSEKHSNRRSAWPFGPREHKKASAESVPTASLPGVSLRQPL